MKFRLSLLSLLFFALFFGFSTKVAFADTVTLSGNVKDSGGSAISGATVSVNDANSSSTNTDSSGNYTLAISSGTYNVEATPPSGSTFSPAIALSQSISTNTVLNFILTSVGTTNVYGHIYDASGTPVPNQTVGLLKYSDSSEVDVTTDSAGAYSFDQVTSGANYRFIVRGGSSTLKVPQHYSIFFNFTPSQTTILDITIPAKEVTMHIQDGSQNPVSNVAISAGPSGGPGNPVSLSLPINGFTASAETSYDGNGAVTNASGDTTLWLLPNDSGYPNHLYSFTATPPNGSGFNTTILSNIPITSASQQTITLQEPVSVTGHIYDAGGTPVPNQTVSLLKYSDGSQVDVTTDNSGAYTFQNVIAGTRYRFIVNGGSSTFEVPKSYSIFFNYTPTQTSTLDITIPAKKVIMHVKDAANNPVSNVAISAGPSGGPGNPVNLSLPINGYTATATTSYSGSSPVTDSSGSVTLWLLPNDSGYPTHLYSFTATPPNGSNLFSTTLSNTSITADTNLTITMQEPVTISGHIYDPSGDALPNQTVRLLKYSDGSTVDVTTDSAGAYSFQQVTTGTTYRFMVRGGNGNNASVHVPQNYSMFGDYTPTQDATIDVTVPAKKVTVHVQDALNNPVNNIAITANPASGTDGPVNYSLAIGGGIVGTSTTSYESDSLVTDSSGNAILWLLPNNDSNNFSNHLYVLTATPPNGSAYSSFALNNISVTEDQTELISLQYNHDTPVTTANLATQHPDDTYSDPTTVTLSSTATSGYTVANTYYAIDGSSQQTYSSPFTITGNGSHTITYWSIDNSGVQEQHNSKTFTITAPTPQLTSLSPAKVWIGVKNSDDIGIKFDLKAEVYKGTNLISSGEVDSVAGGSNGFAHAQLNAIPFNTFSPINFPAGSQLSIKVYARNACSGSGKNSGTARLWYNDSQANSLFGATIADSNSNYYLLTNSLLGKNAGSGPKLTSDVSAGAKCSAFKQFGTWTITP